MSKKKSRRQSQWLWMLACDRKSTLNKINKRATFVLCRWRRHHCRRRRCLITVIAGRHVHGQNGLRIASFRFKLHINRAAWLSWLSCARRHHQWIHTIIKLVNCRFWSNMKFDDKNATELPNAVSPCGGVFGRLLLEDFGTLSLRRPGRYIRSRLMRWKQDWFSSTTTVDDTYQLFWNIIYKYVSFIYSFMYTAFIRCRYMDMEIPINAIMNWIRIQLINMWWLTYRSNRFHNGNTIAARRSHVLHIIADCVCVCVCRRLLPTFLFQLLAHMRR